MRLHLFANKNKVKVLNEMLKKIEGETGLCSPLGSAHALTLLICEKKNSFSQFLGESMARQSVRFYQTFSGPFWIS